jgi:hypothetical protein
MKHQISEGFLGPFSTIDLDFFFSPSFPGKFNQDFVIEFEDEDSKEVILTLNLIHFIDKFIFNHKISCIYLQKQRLLMYQYGSRMSILILEFVCMIDFIKKLFVFIIGFF